MCHFRHELCICVDCKPTSIVPTLKNFITRGAGSVVVSASNWQADGPGLTRERRSRPDIFGIKIDGQRLTLLNRIGAICHAN